jgi:septal ring factor EnvC (AmiA/AmiB activator)
VTDMLSELEYARAEARRLGQVVLDLKAELAWYTEHVRCTDEGPCACNYRAVKAEAELADARAELAEQGRILLARSVVAGRLLAQLGQAKQANLDISAMVTKLAGERDTARAELADARAVLATALDDHGHVVRSLAKREAAIARVRGRLDIWEYPDPTGMRYIPTREVRDALDGE